MKLAIGEQVTASAAPTQAGRMPAHNHMSKSESTKK
jgi:hypothetical protein